MRAAVCSDVFGKYFVRVHHGCRTKKVYGGKFGDVAGLALPADLGGWLRLIDIIAAALEAHNNRRSIYWRHLTWAAAANGGLTNPQSITAGGRYNKRSPQSGVLGGQGTPKSLIWLNW